MSGQDAKSTEEIIHEMSKAAEELKRDRESLERIVAPVLEASEKLKGMETSLDGYHLETAGSLRRALDRQASSIVAAINRKKKLEAIDAEEQTCWDDILLSARREASIRQLIPDYGRPLLSPRSSAPRSPSWSSPLGQFNLPVTEQEEDAHKASGSFGFLPIPNFERPSLSPRSSTGKSLHSPSSPAWSPRSVKEQKENAENHSSKPKNFFTFNLPSPNRLTIPSFGLLSSSPRSSASVSSSLSSSPAQSPYSVTKQEQSIGSPPPKPKKLSNLFVQSPDSDTLTIPITYGEASRSPEPSPSKSINSPSSSAQSFYSIPEQEESSKPSTATPISSFESVSPSPIPLPSPPMRQKISASLISPSPLKTVKSQRFQRRLIPPPSSPPVTIIQKLRAHLDKIVFGLLIVGVYLGMLGSLGLLGFLGLTPTWGLSIFAGSFLCVLLLYALDYYCNRPSLKELDNYLESAASQCKGERPLLNSEPCPSYNLIEAIRFLQDQDAEPEPEGSALSA